MCRSCAQSSQGTCTARTRHLLADCHLIKTRVRVWSGAVEQYPQENACVVIAKVRGEGKSRGCKDTSTTIRTPALVCARAYSCSCAGRPVPQTHILASMRTGTDHSHTHRHCDKYKHRNYMNIIISELNSHDEHHNTSQHHTAAQLQTLTHCNHYKQKDQTH